VFDEFFEQINFSLKDNLTELQKKWIELKCERLKSEILLRLLNDKEYYEYKTKKGYTK